MFIDKPGGIDVEDCARVSDHLTRLFAVENVEYERLEVRSPGLDRPLKKPETTSASAGQEAELRIALRGRAVAEAQGVLVKGRPTGSWRDGEGGHPRAARQHRARAPGAEDRVEKTRADEPRTSAAGGCAVAREERAQGDRVRRARVGARVGDEEALSQRGVDVRVAIDRETGDYDSFRRWTVVPDEEHEEPSRQIAITDATERDASLKLGDVIEEPLEPIEFGRIGAQAAKQVILQKIRDAEREQILNDFLEREDNLLTGTVKRIERGNVIVESGRIEGVIPRDQLIPKEMLRVGDRIRAYVMKIDRTAKGPQLILSRVAPEFLMRLFELEVPEIEEGLIEIKAAARDPGSPRQDRGQVERPAPRPAGHLHRHARLARDRGDQRARRRARRHHPVGPRTRRSSSSTRWRPPRSQSIVVDEEKHAMDVVVDEENLAIAIGRSGQNVRLASELTGWELNLMSVEESQQKHEDESDRLRALFMEKLDVDEEVADILIGEGFTSLEEVAYVPITEMLEIESFDEDTVNELRSRARNALLTEAIVREESVENVEEALLKLEGMDTEIASTLAAKGITTRDALADLAVDELTELTALPDERAQDLIMKARAHWFEEPAAAAAPAPVQH